MAGQRIRVEGRDAVAVGVVAAVAGVLAAAAGASPTGSGFDAALVAVAAAGAVWAAASAPWWAGVAAAAAGTALASTWWLVLAAAGAAAGGVMIGLARRSLPWSRALVAAVAVQVLARLGDVEFFGFTAAVGIVVLFALTILGVGRRPRRERRTIYLVLAGVAGAVVVSVLGLALAGASARPHLEQGTDAARAGIAYLADGDFAAAGAEFQAAADLFDRAEATLTKPWALPAALVPVVAQHRHSAMLLAGEGADVTASIATALTSIDYDALRLVNGAIDISAIEALQQPIADLNATIIELQQAVIDARDPWLIDTVSDELDELLVEIDEQQARLGNAQAAVINAPAMLGGEGTRRYFIAFTTPSEVRGLGGFMGNWAELTFTDGRASFTGFGRTSDLNVAGDPTDKSLASLPAEYLDRYDDFLLADRETALAGPAVWSNITASPHFPSVAATIAALYPQSGGAQLDGVFMMDVFAIAQLTAITGPVTIADTGRVLDAQTAPEYLLSEQYLLDDNAERIDVLEEVALVTMQRLLTSTLPSPPELGDMFGPLAREGRFVAWAVRPSEQDVFERVNLTGLLPSTDGGDGLAVALNNATGSKIDYYLEGSLDYDVIVDRDSDVVRGTVTLQMTNSAPASRLPEYVIGNSIGRPLGTSSTFLTVYTGLPVVSLSIDDRPADLQVSAEQGYVASSIYVDLAAGETATVELTVEGSIPDDVAYRLTISNAPLVNPFPVTVTVDGEPLGTLDRAGVDRMP